MPNYYAVKKGYVPGIYGTWDECKQQVHGFNRPIFKKFTTIDEAQAFISSNTPRTTRTNSAKSPGSSTNRTSSSIHYTDYNFVKSDYFTLENSYPVSKWTVYNDQYFIFTDGSFKNNDEHFNSGLGVFFGKNALNVKNIYNNKTNNQCELMAVNIAFEIIIKYVNDIVANNKPINIVSDSEYTIKSCTQWIKVWKNNDWKTKSGSNVKNKDIMISILNNMAKLKMINDKLPETKKVKIKFTHIKSHQTPASKSGYDFFIWEGNYIADALAQNKI